MKANSKFFKTLLAAGAVLSVSSFSFAFETGGLLTNDTKYIKDKDEDASLDQKNGLSLWLRVPLTENGSSYFTTEGSFKTEYDTSLPEDDRLILTADLDLFKLVLKKEAEAGTVLFSAGRFYFSDLSGLVVGQNADGAQLDFSSSVLGVSVYGAYTGLLNEKNITILDDPHAGSDSPDPDKVYSLAKKYVFAGLQLSASNFAAGQSAVLESLGAFRLEDGNKFNRFYGTLSLSGPLAAEKAVYYTLLSTLGITQDENDTHKGNLSSISFSWYPDFKSASLSLNGVYASGKQGPFDGFMGFTSQTAAESVSQPEYSGIAKAGLSASIKPTDNLLISAGGDLVLNAAAGDEGKDIEMEGFQCTIGANYQFLSDVSVGATFNQFVGTGDYSSETKTQFKLSASIAF
ncbi:MAG: hypothetical protein II821_01555 [Treponema sp.]|nr:hypothetical protein [Treponema sp.]